MLVWNFILVIGMLYAIINKLTRALDRKVVR